MSDHTATTEDVKRLATLARISVPEASLEAFAHEFDSILSYVGKLNELTLPEGDRVIPVVHNVFRVDENPTPPGTWTKAIVEQFPQKEGDSLSVKKILSHD